MYSSISAEVGVEGSNRSSVSVSVGGLIKPLAASIAGDADMKKPAAKKTRIKEELKRIRRSREGAEESVVGLLDADAGEVDSGEATTDWNLRCFIKVLGIECPV